MQKVVLPRTDLAVSELCLGTADFGAGVSEEESFRLLDIFRDAGGNFLDTALIYADWTPAGKGSSEKVLGRWLRSRQPQNCVVATKGGHPELSTPHKGRLSPRYLQLDVDSSLFHLGTECIDLYYLHRDDTKRPVEEILASLERMVGAGKIRYYAFSNWSVKRAEAARIAAAEGGAHGFVANQPLWSLAQADMTRLDHTLHQMSAGMLAWHRKTGTAAIPYSSQANGFFSKLASGVDPEALPVAFRTEANLQLWERVQRVSRETDYSATQVVLAWLRSHDFPVVPIVGPRNEAQLRDCLTAGGLTLSSGHFASLVL